MKTFKEFISEEGYDIARDRGMVSPSKDKKDATSYPPSKEMRGDSVRKVVQHQQELLLKEHQKKQNSL